MKHKSIILHRRLGRFASILPGLMAWLVLSLRSGAAAPANPAGSDPSQNTQPIAWNELGAKATAQYSGDGLSMNATADGARLRCVFQKLEGEVTPKGLWLSSTAPGSSNTPFRVLATSLGRERGEYRALPSTGTVETTGGLARFIRPGLIEEYSVSVDGLRQDFVLPERLPGEGALRVELKVAGAAAEAYPDGVRMILDSSGRKLNFHRLRATDATGRELAARMEVSDKSESRNPKSEIRLAVVVEDGGAVYPVRIDPTFSDANWISMGGIRGANDWVIASVVDAAGNLYIGGFFSLVGNVFANRIAKWDGSRWSALGSGMEGGAFCLVSALAVSGTDLYAGGTFTTAGGIPANSIAKWNGSSWSALDSGLNGTGINGNVIALAISGSDLYAAGRFMTAGGVAATNIARWNGNSWSALGSGLNDTVSALAVSGTDLYAGGWFTRAGAVGATNVAKWNGSSWSALGSGEGVATGPGILSYVNALAVMGGDLYVAGYFRTVAGTPAISIAKWNGSSWSGLGGLSVYVPDPDFPYYDAATVSALAVSGSNLYAGGSISMAGGTDVDGIAKWNGSNWSAVGGLGSLGVYGLEGVSALAVSGSQLYVAGSKSFAEWNGASWSALGAEETGVVLRLAVSGSDLYAAGSFTTAGGYGAIAKWNGTGWSVLPSGGMHINSYAPLALSGSELFTVEYSPGEWVRVVKWNGSTWSALGSGMPAGPGIYPAVDALAVSGSNLYAAGSFTNAGGIAANNVAKWNGTSWSALGSGIEGGGVSALAVSGSDLYAGGWFTTAGGLPATNITKWNGSTWSTLGSGISAPPDFPYRGGYVGALVASGGDLYAGGVFITAGGIAATNIAKWDGSSWSALGSGLSAPIMTPPDDPYYGGAVGALAMSGGDLYAAGQFITAGGIAASNIAKWNGSSWSALGSGVSGVPGAWLPVPTVSALALAGADLYVGGYFLMAGDKVSANAAKVRIGSAAKSIAKSSGSAVIQFSGVTGYEYDVQRATSLNPPIGWTTVTTSPLSPAANGSFTFTDTNAPPGAAYYRAVQR